LSHSPWRRHHAHQATTWLCKHGGSGAQQQHINNGSNVALNQRQATPAYNNQAALSSGSVALYHINNNDGISVAIM